MLIQDLPGTNAVKVGRLYLKPKSVAETISRVCRTVLLEAEDESLPMWRTGSATLIKYKSRKFVLMTRHELRLKRGVPPPQDILDTVRIVSGKPEHLMNIPLQLCVFESSNPDEEFHDVLVFEVADTWQDKSLDAPYFFPIKPFSNLNRIHSFLVGCPISDDVMGDYWEAHSYGKVGEIHLNVAISDCHIDQSFNSKNAYYRRYISSLELPTMDGYSGGAVFSLVGNSDKLEMILDGIVLRGGKKNIHIIDANYLSKMLSRLNGL